jgi:hypothetical protein
MADTRRQISLSAARRYAEQARTKLEMRQTPTRDDIRNLIDATLSLATQLEAAQHTISETQLQLEQFSTLITQWNELFSAMRQAGLNIWDDPARGIVYQWQDGPVIDGFSSWGAALKAALSSISSSH